MGVVYSAAKFRDEASAKWSVPESEGTYPTFQMGASEEDKKQEISKFIKREKGIKTVKTVELLLKRCFWKLLTKTTLSS